MSDFIISAGGRTAASRRVRRAISTRASISTASTRRPASAAGCGSATASTRATPSFRSACICPDGRIACSFRRPDDLRQRHASTPAASSYSVIEPFRSVAMRYDGELYHRRRPRGVARSADAVRDAAATRRATFASTFYGGICRSMAARPTHDGVQTMYGRDFSFGHFNQHGRVRGEIRVGDGALPDRRARLARPLLGPALLAGDLLLPPVHRQLPQRRRLHAAEDHRPVRPLAPRRRAAGRGTNMRRSPTSTCITEWTEKQDPARVRLGVRTADAQGGDHGRNPDASRRCATAARPTAKCSSRASPRASARSPGTAARASA